MVQVGGSVHWIDYWADRGGMENGQNRGAEAQSEA